MPATSQLDWLISMTAMIVLFWSRATRDLLKACPGAGRGRSAGASLALHRLNAATKLPFPRRPPHSVSRSPYEGPPLKFAQQLAARNASAQHGLVIAAATRSLILQCFNRKTEPIRPAS